MTAIHSIEYDRLPAHFLLFGVRSGREESAKDQTFLSWDDVEARARELDLTTVPVLFRGVFHSLDEMQVWLCSVCLVRVRECLFHRPGWSIARSNPLPIPRAHYPKYLQP
jgi:hypothetical protein